MHVPPGHTHFDRLIPRMLELAHDDKVHPIVRAAELHYNLAAVHPFEDGNGRFARLMMNAVLLQAGYGFCVIRRVFRAEYISALESLHRGGSPQTFLDLILNALDDDLRDGES